MVDGRANEFGKNQKQLELVTNASLAKKLIVPMHHGVRPQCGIR
jgi:hypothetical protein